MKKTVLLAVLMMFCATAMFAIGQEAAGARLAVKQNTNGAFRTQLETNEKLIADNENQRQYDDIIRRINILEGKIYTEQNRFNRDPNQDQQSVLTKLVDEHTALITELQQFVQKL